MKLLMPLLLSIPLVAFGQTDPKMNEEYSMNSIKKMGVDGAIVYLSCRQLQLTETLLRGTVVIGGDGLIVNNQAVDLKIFKDHLVQVKGNNNDWKSHIRIDVESGIQEDLFYGMIETLLDMRIKFCFIL